MESLPPGVLAALVGLVGGVVLGLAARLGNFCTLGAIESAAYGGDQRRLRMWGVVLGTAILSVFGLSEFGMIDMPASIYLATSWNPAASIVGGLIFGYGMALAGNCGFGALSRFGGGEIRAMVVVVVLGIFGFIALNGPLADLRVFLFPMHEAETPQGIAHFLSNQTGLPLMLWAAIAGVGLLVAGLSHSPLRRDPSYVFWGVAAGLAIASAFWGTTLVSHASFEATNVLGHSYTVPVGRTILYLMTTSAGGIDFPIGSVTGVVLGALIGSLIKKDFQWEGCEDPRELGRLTIGAALMGIGGAVAMGCSIGQGVSAFSMLAWSAPVTLISIVAGALFGLSRLLQGYAPE